MPIELKMTVIHRFADDDNYGLSFARQRILLKRLDNIMSAISEFAAKQTAFNTRMETSVQGIGSDIDELNKMILALQNSVGTVTPEDQALLDDLQAKGEALAARFETLDALTPPVPPVA